MGLLDLQTNLKDLKYPSAKESPVIERINEWVDGDGFKDRPLLQGVGLTDDGVDTTFRGGITTWWGRAQTDFVRIKKLVEQNAEAMVMIGHLQQEIDSMEEV